MRESPSGSPGLKSLLEKRKRNSRSPSTSLRAGCDFFDLLCFFNRPDVFQSPPETRHPERSASQIYRITEGFMARSRRACPERSRGNPGDAVGRCSSKLSGHRHQEIEKVTASERTPDFLLRCTHQRPRMRLSFPLPRGLSLNAGLCFFQEFRPVLRGSRLCFLQEFHHLLFIQFGGRRCACGHGYSDFQEEFVVACRRADADHACRLGGGVVEAMRCIGWNVCRFACAHDRCLAPESHLDFTVEHDKRLFEVMAMRPGPSS